MIEEEKFFKATKVTRKTNKQSFSKLKHYREVLLAAYKPYRDDLERCSPDMLEDFAKRWQVDPFVITIEDIHTICDEKFPHIQQVSPEAEFDNSNDYIYLAVPKAST